MKFQTQHFIYPFDFRVVRKIYMLFLLLCVPFCEWCFFNTFLYMRIRIDHIIFFLAIANTFSMRSTRFKANKSETRLTTNQIGFHVILLLIWWRCKTEFSTIYDKFRSVFFSCPVQSAQISIAPKPKPEYHSVNNSFSV